MTRPYNDGWERQNMCVAKGEEEGGGMIGVQPIREPPYHPDIDNPAITEINI